MIFAWQKNYFAYGLLNVDAAEDSKGIKMLKTAVKIDFQKIENKEVPVWALAYLKNNDLLDIIVHIKNSKRYIELIQIIENIGKSHVLKQIYFNAKGDVVFYWNTPQEKTAFMLKWI